MMNDCEQASMLLPQYAAHTLNAGERSLVVVHLARCPACRKEAAMWFGASQALAGEPVPEAAVASAFDLLPGEEQPKAGPAAPLGAVRESLGLTRRVLRFAFQAVQMAANC